MKQLKIIFSFTFKVCQDGTLIFAVMTEFALRNETNVYLLIFPKEKQRCCIHHSTILAYAYTVCMCVHMYMSIHTHMHTFVCVPPSKLVQK